MKEMEVRAIKKSKGVVYGHVSVYGIFVSTVSRIYSDDV